VTATNGLAYNTADQFRLFGNDAFDSKRVYMADVAVAAGPYLVAGHVDGGVDHVRHGAVVQGGVGAQQVVLVAML
jgi:hypothetical protein